MEVCLPVHLELERKLAWVAWTGSEPPAGQVVVRTPARGLQVGVVRGSPRENRPGGSFVRMASTADLERSRQQEQRADEIAWWLRARLRQGQMVAKVSRCAFSLDGERFYVFYSAEERVDLKPFLAGLAEQSGARVEFVALGPRESAAFTGTLGACGMESCCSTWLSDFAPVGIRMARDQQLPLNPEKVSGPCGRLLCCLAYEHPVYKELLSELPATKARVCTKAGVCGKVIKLEPLAGAVEILSEAGGVIRAAKEDLA